jgi:hypothetical protein
MWNRDSPKNLGKKISRKFFRIFFWNFFLNFFFEFNFFLKTWLAEICKADPRVNQITALLSNFTMFSAYCTIARQQPCRNSTNLVIILSLCTNWYVNAGNDWSDFQSCLIYFNAAGHLLHIATLKQPKAGCYGHWDRNIHCHKSLNLCTLFLIFFRPWKDHFKSDLRSDQDHLLKKDLRSDQDHIKKNDLDL